MIEILMTISGYILAVLFVVVFFINFVIFLSWFVKKKHVIFEPCVSVVIPVFNEEKNIDACLASVFASKYPRNKYDVIVVDDGSTDGTVEHFRVWKPVSLVRTAHCGKADALTAGIKAAKHDFIVTVDADSVLDVDCLRSIVLPMSDARVGAIAGMTKVKNKHSLLGMFQNVEYFYNNLIRKAFSLVFNNTVWFHGAIACYRKQALIAVGFFKKDTLAEDLDVSMEMYKEGYLTLHSDACVHTSVPLSVRDFLRQRGRWCAGVFQSLEKNKSILNRHASFSWWFVLLNQCWWAFFAFVSFPLFALQIAYWFPLSGSFVEVLAYLFRWVSLSGPVYVVYKLPVWGVSWYGFFGVLSGLLSVLFMFFALKLFKERLFFRNLFVLFFYFPYTWLLNIGLIAGVFSYKFYKGVFFIR